MLAVLVGMVATRSGRVGILIVVLVRRLLTVLALSFGQFLDAVQVLVTGQVFLIGFQQVTWMQHHRRC